LQQCDVAIVGWQVAVWVGFDETGSRDWLLQNHCVPGCISTIGTQTHRHFWSWGI